MLKIKKGDIVQAIKGKDAGKKGKVLRIQAGNKRVIVEGINLVKKHKRKTQQDQQGEWLARRIATIGNGRYYKVKTPESLPIDALNIVQ